jgi:predicted O-methyltransferase YrrM
VIEIGTSTGYSGTWISLALLKTNGKLTSFELDPGRAAMAREHFKKAGVDHIVTVVQGDAHQNVTKATRNNKVDNIVNYRLSPRGDNV